MLKKIQKIIDADLEKMIEQQRKKVLKVARSISPHVTPEDLRNPQDLPELYEDALFNYEDGILAGYIAMQVSIRNRIKEL